MSGEDHGPAHTSTLAQGVPTTVRQEIHLFQALDGDLFTAALRCAKAQGSTRLWGLRRHVPHQSQSRVGSRAPGGWMEGLAGGREVGSPDLG